MEESRGRRIQRGSLNFAECYAMSTMSLLLLSPQEAIM